MTKLVNDPNQSVETMIFVCKAQKLDAHLCVDTICRSHPLKARWQCFTKFYHSRKDFQPCNQYGLDWLLLIGSLSSRLLMSKHLLNFLHLSIDTTASPLSAISTLKDVQLVRCQEWGPPRTGEPQLLRHIKRNVLRRFKSHWTPLSDPRNLLPTLGSIC